MKTRLARIWMPLREIGSWSPARQASILFLAAGLLTLTNNHLPGESYHVINDAVGIAAIAATPLGWLLPWGRWPTAWTLAYFPFCLALLVINGLYGSTPSQIYGVWFVVAFVWVGLHHPPRTSMALALPAAFAYLVPLVAVTHPSGQAIRSVAMAIPAAVLIGEILSTTNTALRRARAAQDQANVLLASAAVTDDLTGLGNRRFVNALLDGLSPGDAVLLLDLDHFKRVNDELGHRAGDDLLADLGKYLAASTRGGGDAVARYGGEEFLIVLRAPSGTDALMAAAERMLQGWRDRGPLVTFSLGGCIHDEHRSPWSTLAEADTALYRAKANGRDRYEIQILSDGAPLML